MMTTPKPAVYKGYAISLTGVTSLNTGETIMKNRYLTTDPETVFAAIKELARADIHRGAKRISVRKLVEVVRSTCKAQINNSDMTAITDRLIAEIPGISALIETRVRGTRGKNKPVTNTCEFCGPGPHPPGGFVSDDQIRSYETGFNNMMQKFAIRERDLQDAASDNLEESIKLGNKVVELEKQLAQAIADRDFLLDLGSRMAA